MYRNSRLCLALLAQKISIPPQPRHGDCLKTDMCPGKAFQTFQNIIVDKHRPNTPDFFKFFYFGPEHRIYRIDRRPFQSIVEGVKREPARCRQLLNGRPHYLVAAFDVLTNRYECAGLCSRQHLPLLRGQVFPGRIVITDSIVSNPDFYGTPPGLFRVRSIEHRGHRYPVF